MQVVDTVLRTLIAHCCNKTNYHDKVNTVMSRGFKVKTRHFIFEKKKAEIHGIKLKPQDQFKRVIFRCIADFHERIKMQFTIFKYLH